MLDIIDNSENDKVKKMCWFIIKERFDPARFVENEKNLIYGDYKIENIKKYPFKDDFTREMSQAFVHELKKKLPRNSVEKYSKNIM